MAITYAKDIPDFVTKVKQITNISELETTVSQLSSSLVTLQGDVEEAQDDITTLGGAVTTLDGVVENITEYSTNEKIVGKWIDGSNIYEKTFHNSETILLTASDWTNDITFVDASNISLLIDAEAVRTIGATSVYGYFQYAITAATGKFNIFNARNLAVEIDTITLRYTKSTT